MVGVPGIDSGWPATGETPAVTLRDGALFLKQRFWLIVGCVAGTFGLAILYLAVTPPTYVATAQLLIEPAKQQALWQDNSILDLTIDNAQVESQVQVLQSERIANSVIAALSLASDPDFGSNASSDYERQRLSLSRFAGALSARRIGQSYVIEVSFRSCDPEKAAQITNAITAAYLRDQRDAKGEVAKEASQWMEGRITELGVQLNTAAAAAQQYRVAHGIVDAGTQSRLMDKLTELEARAEAYKRVYENLLQRLTENMQQASFPIASARVITSASRPLVTSYPKAKLTLALGILGGVLVGLAAAAARAMLDGTVRSASQIRQISGLVCLGTLPVYRGKQNGRVERNHIETVDAPFSAFSEAMRNIHISIQNLDRDKPSRCFGIVSMMPDEGTSTFALNLAASFGLARSKTLLIDADFHERTLSRRMAPTTIAGLVEALEHGDAIAPKFDPKTGVHLLAVAEAEAKPNAGDLLGSQAVPRLLEALRAKYATIVVDLPALTSSVSARAIAPFLDGCILVAGHGRSSLSALQNAVEMLRADGATVRGVVLTRVPDGIPPLFGWHFDDLRELDYGRYVDRFVQTVSR